jgi:hypothetical protein
MAPDALATIEHWVAVRKAVWNNRFDHLGEFLAEGGDGEEKI